MGRLFISYSTIDKDRAKQLNDALIEAGCDVWWDATWMGDLDLIEDRIHDGLMSTSLTVILASRHWLQSRACKWEMLYSLQLGTQVHADRLALVLIDDLAATEFGHARARHALTWFEDSDLPGIVTQLAQLAGSLPEPLSTDASRKAVLDMPFFPGSRNVVRAAPLLEVFDYLRAPLGTVESGGPRQQPMCAIRGMGGIGKSSLASFFVQQFGPAYDAVVWLNAAGDQVRNQDTTLEGRDLSPEDQDIVYRALFESAWKWFEKNDPDRLSLSNLPADPKARWERIVTEFTRRVEPEETMLLVIDDVPSGIDANTILPKSTNISLLATTRDAQFTQAVFPPFQLQGFLPEEALDVFNHAVDPSGEKRRAGVPLWEGGEKQARELIESVAGHPLAIDLLAIRLADGESISHLIQDVKTGADEFLDIPREIISLPTNHDPSILSSIAGSLRWFARSTIRGDAVEAVPGLLRAMMVLPAGTSASIKDLSLLLGDSTTKAVSLAQNRSVLSRVGEDSITWHSLTRAVALRLWEREQPPFEGNRSLEPDLSLKFSQLLFDNVNRLRSKDIRASAQEARLCLAVLEGVRDRWGARERMRASECLAAEARERYRTGVRTVDDCQHAIEWTEAAKDVLGDSRCEVFSWWSVEALRGLVLAELATPEISPQLSPSERFRQQEAALGVCLTADAKRRDLVEQMSDSEREEVNATDVLLRSLYNIPGRRLQLAKAYVALDPPQMAAAAEHLHQMDEEHAEVIARREALPNPVRPDIAASIWGRGLAAYYRAVLLDLSSDERLSSLERAIGFLFTSLQYRVETSSEMDVCKSLEVLTKTCWAIQCVIDGRDATLERALNDISVTRVEAGRAGCDVPYHDGVPRGGHVDNKCQVLRDEYATTFEQWYDNPEADIVAMRQQISEDAIGWLAAAQMCGLTKGNLDSLAKQFFGEGSNLGESARLSRLVD